jgi:hypothetical protein
MRSAARRLITPDLCKFRDRPLNTLAHAAASGSPRRRGDAVMFNQLIFMQAWGWAKPPARLVTWAGNSGNERRVLYLTAEGSCTASSRR